MNGTNNRIRDDSLLSEYRKIIPNAAWGSPQSPEELRRQSDDFFGYSAKRPVTVSGYTGV
jgi:hypothetical protein